MENNLYVSPSPHIHGGDSISKNMYGVLIALIPAFLVSLYFFGLGALIVTVVSVLACMIFEYLIQRFLMKKEPTLCDGSAILTGVLLAFNLPSNLPVWIIIIGALAAIGIGKMSFGGLGNNIFNPALVGRVFLLISFPAQMTTWTMPWNTAAAEAVTKATPYTDAVSSATPLAALRLAESAWQRGLNVDLPSLSALFWGNVGGSLGETCVPALLLGGIYLLWRGHIDWRIPAGYIGTVVVITAIYGWLREYPAWFAIYHLLSGGLIIGAFFMATDWVTSPITKKGRLIYALGLGILTALIRLRGGYVEGVCYSILIMNMVTPLIDRYVTNVPFGGGARHE